MQANQIRAWYTYMETEEEEEYPMWLDAQMSNILLTRRRKVATTEQVSALTIILALVE